MKKPYVKPICTVLKMQPFNGFLSISSEPSEPPVTENIGAKQANFADFTEEIRVVNNKQFYTLEIIDY